MRAGPLRDRVQLQAPVRTPRGDGEDDITWTAFADVWAEIKDLTGAEFFAAQQINTRATTRIRLRHRSDVTRETRVVPLSGHHQGRTFDVVDFQEVGNLDGLLLICEGRA